MSLAGLGHKSGFRHVCLIIAYTGQQGSVLYIGDKYVYDADGPPEGGQPEIGGLSPSSLSWNIDRQLKKPLYEEVTCQDLLIDGCTD